MFIYFSICQKIKLNEFKWLNEGTILYQIYKKKKKKIKTQQLNPTQWGGS